MVMSIHGLPSAAGRGRRGCRASSALLVVGMMLAGIVLALIRGRSPARGVDPDRGGAAARSCSTSWSSSSAAARTTSAATRSLAELEKLWED